MRPRRRRHRSQRAIDRPWIADLGDPWALDEMMIYPTGLHRRLECRLMRRGLSTAAAIVMSTPEAARRVRAAFPELADKIVARFRTASRRPSSSVRRLRATTARSGSSTPGYLHTDLGHASAAPPGCRRLLGGAVPGVDILSRSHVYLIEAVERVRRERPELGERIEIHFAGVLSPRDLEVARTSPAARILGFVPHDESLALMRSADLLFLPMHDLPDGNARRSCPGKTYEYIASGRPILAAVPDGDARDLLAAAGTAFLCRPDGRRRHGRGDRDGVRAVRAGRARCRGRPQSCLRRYEYRRSAPRDSRRSSTSIGLDAHARRPRAAA